MSDKPRYIKLIEEDVVEKLGRVDLTNSSWKEDFLTYTNTELHNIVMWYLRDLVREKSVYTPIIFELAKMYSIHADPAGSEASKLNDQIIAGDEISYITTVRGVACWLLLELAATFNTDYYAEIIDCLEKLTKDRVSYVRMQAINALVFFTRNIRATENKDGTRFDYTDEQKARVKKISFDVLIENRDTPRVIEVATSLFDALRDVSTDHAKVVFDHVFYNSKAELQPDYVLQRSVPVLLYFADFRELAGSEFQSQYFKNKVCEFLSLPEVSTVSLKETIIWNIWKEIKQDKNSYLKFEKYFGIMLDQTKFEPEVLDRFDLLVSVVIEVNVERGIELFNSVIDYVINWQHRHDWRAHPWLLHTVSTMSVVANLAPKEFTPLLRKLVNVYKALRVPVQMGEIFKLKTSIHDKQIVSEIGLLEGEIGTMKPRYD